MNDGHHETHAGLAPGCRMWTPILPVPASAVSAERVLAEKAGNRPPIKNGIPAATGGADKNAQKT